MTSAIDINGLANSMDSMSICAGPRRCGPASWKDVKNITKNIEKSKDTVTTATDANVGEKRKREDEDDPKVGACEKRKRSIHEYIDYMCELEEKNNTNRNTNNNANNIRSHGRYFQPRLPIMKMIYAQRDDNDEYDRQDEHESEEFTRYQNEVEYEELYNDDEDNDDEDAEDNYWDSQYNWIEQEVSKSAI